MGGLWRTLEFLAIRGGDYNARFGAVIPDAQAGHVQPEKTAETEMGLPAARRPLLASARVGTLGEKRFGVLGAAVERLWRACGRGDEESHLLRLDRGDR